MLLLCPIARAADTSTPERGIEWPRHYTAAELEALAKALGLKTFTASIIEQLQMEVDRFQWATRADAQISYKRQRDILNRIIELFVCHAPDDAIWSALDELDGPTSQRLGPIPTAGPWPLDTIDRKALARKTRAVREKLQPCGPNPERARRQFIRGLLPIYRRARRGYPGRRIKAPSKPYGPLYDFVTAAIYPFDPFKATMGCDDDIGAVLRRRKNARASKKPRNFVQLTVSIIPIISAWNGMHTPAIGNNARRSKWKIILFSQTCAALTLRAISVNIMGSPARLLPSPSMRVAVKAQRSGRPENSRSTLATILMIGPINASASAYAQPAS